MIAFARLIGWWLLAEAAGLLVLGAGLAVVEWWHARRDHGTVHAFTAPFTGAPEREAFTRTRTVHGSEETCR